MRYEFKPVNEPESFSDESQFYSVETEFDEIGVIACEPAVMKWLRDKLNKAYMIGKRAGERKTEKKAVASRINGRKGGRPRTKGVKNDKTH